MLKVRLGACLFQPPPPPRITPDHPRITQKVRAEAEQEAARTRASAQAKVEQLQRAFAKVKPTKSQRSHEGFESIVWCLGVVCVCVPLES